MGTGIYVRAVAAVVSTVGLSTVFGCPICTTETGSQVREQIFNETFVPNLAATVAPFLVLGIGLLGYGLFARGSSYTSDILTQLITTFALFGVLWAVFAAPRLLVYQLATLVAGLRAPDDR